FWLVTTEGVRVRWTSADLARYALSGDRNGLLSAKTPKPKRQQLSFSCPVRTCDDSLMVVRPKLVWSVLSSCYRYPSFWMCLTRVVGVAASQTPPSPPSCRSSTAYYIPHCVPLSILTRSLFFFFLLHASLSDVLFVF
ncbi:unnamed protein product, partial [Ectocarpus sp. 4 AP-2014]